MDMNNSNFNKEGILEVLKDNIIICNEHTTNILNAKYVLDAYGVKSEVRQCWKINGHKANFLEAYIIIYLELDNCEYYIDILNNISITKKLGLGVFKRKPSKKHIDKYIKHNIT